LQATARKLYLISRISALIAQPCLPEQEERGRGVIDRGPATLATIIKDLPLIDQEILISPNTITKAIIRTRTVIGATVVEGEVDGPAEVVGFLQAAYQAMAKIFRSLQGILPLLQRLRKHLIQPK
jgi:hypothetical protein